MGQLRRWTVLALATAGLSACGQSVQLTGKNDFCGFETVELATRAPRSGAARLASAVPPPAPPPPAMSPIGTPPASPMAVATPPPMQPLVGVDPGDEEISPLAASIEGSLRTNVAYPEPPAPPPPPPPPGTPFPPSPPPVVEPEPSPPPEPDILLALSGGSENGSFGAGVLSGWNGPLPEFRTVTGVSTGAILASFAFAGDKTSARLGYTIESERQLLTPFVTPREGRITTRNFPTLLRRGAFADLVPLRSRLRHFLTDGVMGRIASAHLFGRRLYVGATDVDTGEGVAFDLGEMATRYVSAQDPAKKERWMDCYIDAIIASSSTPMAAPPVAIDNTLYIDGGSRFGMFTSAMMEVRRKRAALQSAGFLAPPPTIYAVVNGTLNLPAPKCPKLDPAACTSENPTGGRDGQHRKWNILELALGSEKVLVNQVYRFSAQEIGQSTCDEAGCLNFMRIDDDVADFRHTLPNPEKGGEPDSLSCRQWRDIDNRVDNPVQFHKRFMRCLIAYGEKRVGEAGWGQ